MLEYNLRASQKSELYANRNRIREEMERVNRKYIRMISPEMKRVVVERLVSLMGERKETGNVVSNERF